MIKSPCLNCPKKNSNKFGGAKAKNVSCAEACKIIKDVQDYALRIKSAPYSTLGDDVVQLHLRANPANKW